MSESHTQAAMGQALAEAQVYGDAVAAERYGVALGTIRTWRHLMADDAAIQAAYRAASQELLQSWASQASRLYAKIVEKIEQRIEDDDRVELLELQALLRTVGEQLVQGQAIGNALASTAPITAPGARKGTRLQ